MDDLMKMMTKMIEALQSRILKLEEEMHKVSARLTTLQWILGVMLSFLAGLLMYLISKGGHQ